MDNSVDTITAISTPVGFGGIGIVKLSGDSAVSIADSLFKSKSGKKLSVSNSHKVFYGHLIEPSSGNVMDEVIITVMKAPKTYTCEDIVEINCHSGTVVLKQVLETVVKAGARMAEPGEFTKRAYLNGRIDLTQAEAISNLINSRTKTAARVALAQIGGRLSEKIKDIQSQLLTIHAELEAAVDFSDEDIEAADVGIIKTRVSDIAAEINRLLETKRLGKVVTAGLSTAIIGRANVGKSSLLNTLIDDDRSIVTSLPGTTRDVIETVMDIGGIPIKLCDTAGIRIPGDEAEAAGVALSKKTALEADLVLFVLDGSMLVSEEDKQIISQVVQGRAIVVINKSDLPQKIDLEEISIQNVIKKVSTSSINGDGIEELKRSIKEYATFGSNIEDDVIIANVRHEYQLEQALESLREMEKAIEEGYTEEILTESLKMASKSLGDIVGATSYDDLLDEIFSKFCIGK